MKPLVTIGVPVFNTEKYLYKAIKSALLQTYGNVEVIVVDDCSTDNTASICRAFKDKVRYFRNRKNMGIGYGRCKVVKEAKGDYIAFCSADDILSTMFVEEMVKVAEKNPGKILYCGNILMDEKDDMISQYNPPSFEDHDDFCVSSFEVALRNTMFVNFSCIMIPRDAFKKVNFNPMIRFGEDLDFLLKSMKHFQYVLVDKPLVKYRKHEGMVTVKKWNFIDENNREIVKNWLKYWRGGK